MNRWKWLLKFLVGILILPSAMWGIFFFLENHGFFNIDKIDLAIETNLEQNNYLQGLVKDLDQKLESFRGVSLWKLDLAVLNRQLSQEGWIEDLSLSRRWPSGLFVKVKAKEINFVMMSRQGQFLPIVKSGEALPAVELKQVPDVPLLRGENFESQLQLRQQAVQLLEEIPQQGSFTKKMISEIHFDHRDGFWLTLVKDGIQVKLGQGQIPIKSSRVSQVLDYIDSRQLDARVIDANLSKKVLVRLRKGL